MKNFKDFNIQPVNDHFIGDKLKISKVLNQEIVVHNYKINESKFEKPNNKNYLKMQVEFKGEKHVLFTGSKILTKMIEQIKAEDLPFSTTITKEGESFKFN